jgi:hypothetical protein
MEEDKAQADWHLPPTAESSKTDRIPAVFLR